MGGFSLISRLAIEMEDDVAENNRLDAEIDRARAKLASMLLLPALFATFCGVCGVQGDHASHILEQKENEVIYKSMHCGKRTQRPELLRCVNV